MTRPDRSDQRGQVLVIFAGGLLTLLVIAALVIDLGFVFMIRRAEQNAADPGAIAAARFIPAGDYAGMVSAACFYAQQNGFFSNAPGYPTSIGCVPGNDPNGTTLTVNYPPSAAAGEFAGYPGFVEVGIARQHVSFLARIIGINQIGVASSAVAAFNSPGNSNSNSLVALDTGGTCAAGHVHGTGTVNIHPVTPGIDGGYVHVNSTCSTGPKDTTCDNGSGALKVDGTSTLTAPHVYVTGTCQSQSTMFPLNEGAVQIGDPLLQLPPPKLSDYPNGQCGSGGPITTAANPVGCRFSGSGTVNLNPGVYYGGWDIRNSVELVLAPGMYIIAGGGVKLNAGGSITSVQGGSGAPAPVMFYNTDSPTCASGGPCQADVDFQASAELKLHAIGSGPYKGILIWNDGKGSNPTSQIFLGGQIQLDVAGTIYSPKGFVKIDGGSGVGSSAAIQVIAWQFDVGGNSVLDMPYDPAALYHIDYKGLVY